jgi:hypothetical protein
MKLHHLAFYAGFCAVSGCGVKPTVVTQTAVITPHFSPELLTCDPEPPIPDLATQASIADFLVADDAAGQNCRLHLAAVAKVLATPPVQVPR